MISMDGFLLRIRRADTPFFAALKRFGKGLFSFQVPVPSLLRPVFGGLYGLHFFIRESIRWVISRFYFSPLFRSRCAVVGKRLRMEQLPEIGGQVKIVLGDDVYISGACAVGSGRVYDQPELIVGNRVFLGHPISFSISQRIEIEDDVLISGGCYIMDSYGHPKDPERRAAGDTSDKDDIRPVKICRKVWIGRGCTILAGVTIGEGSIIGAGSIVTRDVPPFSTCAGNTARILNREAI